MQPVTESGERAQEGLAFLPRSLLLPVLGAELRLAQKLSPSFALETLAMGYPTQSVSLEEKVTFFVFLFF